MCYFTEFERLFAKRCQAIVGVFATLFASLLIILEIAAAASFNCNEATTEVEKWICADANLSDEDERLAALYKTTLRLQDFDEGVIADQRSWLKERNRCDSPGCLRIVYRSRIEQLETLATGKGGGDQVAELIGSGKDAVDAGDYGRALRILEPLASSGNAEAQFNMGRLYARGNGVEKDFLIAYGWFRKSAEQGHTRSQYFLGQMYEFGDGVQIDLSQALAWYQKAADSGHARAPEKVRRILSVQSASARTNVQAQEQIQSPPHQSSTYPPESNNAGYDSSSRSAEQRIQPNSQAAANIFEHPIFWTVVGLNILVILIGATNRAVVFYDFNDFRLCLLGLVAIVGGALGLGSNPVGLTKVGVYSSIVLGCVLLLYSVYLCFRHNDFRFHGLLLGLFKPGLSSLSILLVLGALSSFANARPDGRTTTGKKKGDLMLFSILLLLFGGLYTALVNGERVLERRNSNSP